MSCFCTSFCKWGKMEFRTMMDAEKLPRIHNDDSAIMKPEQESEEREGDDLFHAIRKPLWVGIILVLIPIRGIFSENTSELTFSWLHWRTGLTTLIVLITGCNLVLIAQYFLRMIINVHCECAGQVVSELCGVVFYGSGMAIYTFFLLRSKHLLAYFHLWRQTSKEIQDTLIPDSDLTCHSNLIALVVLGSCFGENFMFHFHIMNPELRARFGELTLDELLQDFYNNGNSLSKLFPYNTGIAVFFLAVHKLTLYAWNFGDVFLMLLCRGIYGRFEGLNRYLESQLSVEEFGCALMITKGSVNWKSIRKNFLRLTALLGEANKVFSPLIWLSSLINILFVCNQLYLELSPSNKDPPLVSQFYVGWSILHLIIRTFVVNMMAAKINVSAHRIFHTLQHCAPEEYDDDVRRLEQYLGTRDIGLSGNGCFVITMSFIIKIISAIFTLEVLLLQNSKKIT